MTTSKHPEPFSSDKRKLLSKLLAEKGINTSQKHPIPMRGDANPIPLSFSQQWLWFFEQLEPDNPYYNILNAVHIAGPLNVAALEQSLGELVRRHEALRTTFVMNEGQPIQVIRTARPIPLPVVDLRPLSALEQEQEVRRRVQEELLQPFDLSQGPLVRAQVLRLDHRDHVLLLSMHHLVSDGWSRGILAHELSILYAAYVNERPSPLPSLPFQYADYTVWQRSWLRGEVLEQQLAYWYEQLAGASMVLELPSDHPCPAIQTLHGDSHLFTMSSTLRENLVSLSRQQGTTLFMTLLAAFQLLLHLYTGQNDFIVFSRIANRNRPDLKDIIGCFFKMLALRSDLSGNPTFSMLLRRVREVCLGAYAHQDVPFDQVMQILRGGHTRNLSSRIQVVFELSNFPRLDVGLLELTTSLLPLRVSSNITPFDLDLTMIDTKQQLSGILEYNSDLFNAATINDILRRFTLLLEDIVVNPNLPLLDAQYLMHL